MPAHPRLVAYARNMRSDPTTSEALLWEQLSGSKLGVPFRRQLPIGRYIADFAAPSIKLVIEIDGGYHAQRARQDQRRDRQLAVRGYRVVHVPAALVVQDIVAALALVLHGIGACRR